MMYYYQVKFTISNAFGFKGLLLSSKLTMSIAFSLKRVLLAGKIHNIKCLWF